MINDARAIKFSNEVVRPFAEKLRDFKAEIDSAMVTWFGGTNSLFPNSADENLVDGRATSGISVLTGADVNNVIVQIAAIQTLLNQSGVADIISKPCTRSIITIA